MPTKSSRHGNSFFKFWAPAKIWLIYAKNDSCKIFFFCNAKIATTQALQSF